MSAVKLLPCPFCEGPPVVIVQNDSVDRGVAPLLDDYGDDGLPIRAFVFCHECGAEGPAWEDWIHFGFEYQLAEHSAVAHWQERGNRHRCLYDGGEADGLNLYPRNPPPANREGE